MSTGSLPGPKSAPREPGLHLDAAPLGLGVCRHLLDHRREPFPQEGIETLEEGGAVVLGLV